jgi:hypothetical protein
LNGTLLNEEDGYNERIMLSKRTDNDRFSKVLNKLTSTSDKT